MPRSTARPLSQLPRLPETWFIATARLRIWIVPEEDAKKLPEQRVRKEPVTSEAPYRPYALLVLGPQTLRDSEMTPAPPTAGEVWDALSKAMRRPVQKGAKPGMPQQVVVSDPALAEALRSSLADAKLQVDVREEPLPGAVTDLMRGIESELRGNESEHPSLLSVPGVTEQMLKSFYAAAAEFYRAAPWVALDNHQIVAVRLPGGADYAYALILGNQGVEYGIARYETWDDVVGQFTDYANPTDNLPPHGLHTLFFNDITKVPFDDLEAIESHHWDIAAPEAYPVPIIITAEGQVQRPPPQELLWYEAALRAIPLLLSSYLKPDARGDYEPIEMTLDVPTHAGTLAVAVKYPAGEIPLGKQPAWQEFPVEPGDEEEDEGPEVFDRRKLEGPLQELALSLGAEDNDGDPKLARAQEMMYEAFDEPDRRKRIALAHKALDISPNCADAYVLLAEDEADTLEQALTYYEQGVAAGERALGEKYFKEYAGHFWGLMETRPYMRARAGLADVLWQLKRQEEARRQYEEMLRLNPGDNQGMRYILLSLFLDMEQEEQAEQLLNEYRGDWSAVWKYTRALLEFRKHGASAQANKALAGALKHNPHVPAYLTGKKRIPPQLPALMGMGDENEAVSYAAEHLNYWRRTPGDIEWLTERQSKPKTKRTAKKSTRKAKGERG